MQRPPQQVIVRVDTPTPAPSTARLLRRGGEPMPAVPAEEGPSWMEALSFIATSLGWDH
jgi:hypothetical protein